uniref:Ig-like domain-containing protein n=1 Tax=Hucho hucho TaxID=62062 RepID=A0A4W5NHI7_9TELE
MLVFLFPFDLDVDHVDLLSPVITVQLGDPVTLLCVFPEEEFNDEQMHWYKQTVGGTPQLVASMQKYLTEPVFHSGYNNSHFNVKLDQMMFGLTITKMFPEDEAMYYCAIGREMTVEFRDGTFLSLKGNGQRSDYQTVEQQPEYDPVHPGDSVTLLCTVLSETCTGEHNVYWFRAGSGESHPGVIYTTGNRSDECKKSPETPSPTQSCVYSLSKNNLSPSDAGTYYCAVATCGQILFGDRKKLNVIKGNTVDAIVLSLGAAVSVCVIVIFILSCTKNKRQTCDHCKASVSQHIHHDDNLSSEQSSGQVPNTEILNYAALHFSEKKRGRKKRETPQESVYSDVRYSDWE